MPISEQFRKDEPDHGRCQERHQGYRTDIGEQDNFLRKKFQVSHSEAPKGILDLDGQMLSTKWRIT